MKAFALTLIVLVAMPFATNAQFISVTDCDLNGADHSLYFINADTGFVAGEAYGKGIIQKTVDGGITWTNVYTSTSNLEWVYDICFSSTNIGVAVGENGTILRSIDGGTNWNRQTISNVSSFGSVNFPSTTVGYIVGTGATEAQIYKTTDAGLNWSAQISNADSNSLGSVFFLNLDTGYAVGSYDILRTYDGGTTWTRSDNSYMSNGKIFCPDYETCYIASYEGPMIKTADAGSTWNPLSFPTLSPPFIYLTTSTYFTDAQTGYAVGAKYDTINLNGIGTIFKTTNGGQTWYNINTTANNAALENQFLTSVQFVSPQLGYALGGGGNTDGGKVLKTTNAGGQTIGLEDLGKNLMVSNIYPNPFSTWTTIETNSQLIDGTLTVNNFVGQTVYTMDNLNGQIFLLQRNNLPSGIYFINIVQAGKIISNTKLVIVD